MEKWKWGFGKLKMKRLWEIEELQTGLLWKWEMGMGIGKWKTEMGEWDLRTIRKFVNGEWDYQTNEGDDENRIYDV